MWSTLHPDKISFEDANEILADPQQSLLFPDQFASLLTSISSRLNEVQLAARAANPLAWIQPSYEQTLKLNCWVLGIDYLIDFDANRIGKTAAGVVNALLWLLPTQADWILHQPFTDARGRTFQTLPRPPIIAVAKIADYVAAHNLTPDPRLPYDHPQNLPTYQAAQRIIAALPLPHQHQNSKIVWVGAPDNDYQEEIIMPEFKKWIPSASLEDYSAYAHTIRLSPSITILFKSYDSKDTKWSGAAVDGIMLTEGVPQDVFNEVRQRFKYPAFGSWDYTPYEQRNTASKSALAYKVFKGTESLPLHPYVFHGFGIHDTPSYILPDDKKKDMITMWEGKPQGEARIKGLFYSSSPVILKNYAPEIHAIPLTFQQLQEKYHPRPLLLFRGLDPGWGHVTACCWIALAPDNTRYVYKFYSQAQRSIEERVTDIIHLSGNTRQKNPRSPDHFIEVPASPSHAIQITYIDYHSFKTDENTKRPFALNYIKHGLVVRPSITIGPELRATQLNDMLQPQLHLPHPTNPGQVPPGSKIYFLINEPGVAAALAKMTELFWQTFEKGEKRGLPKDTTQDYDDDELDAFAYAALPTLTYQSFFSSIEAKDKAGNKGPSSVLFSNIIYAPR